MNGRISASARHRVVASIEGHMQIDDSLNIVSKSGKPDVSIALHGVEDILTLQLLHKL